MKRIFLTSGLVLCMACPAFAETSFGGATSGSMDTGCIQTNLGVYNGPTTLKAKWDAKTYKLTYVPNTPSTTAASGNTVSGMPVSLEQNVTYDDPYNVASAPSLTGYTFGGWLASDALSDPAPTDNVYAGGASISEYKGVNAQTLTAQWTANKYDVTYANKDGTVTDIHTDDATYDEDYSALDIASTSIVTPTGYTFIGWSSVANPTVARAAGDGTAPVNTGTVSNAWTGETPWRIANDSKTVYAGFLANQYKITYSCTGKEPSGTSTGPATGTVAAQIVTFDSTYTLDTGANCSLPGYTFDGWDCPNLTDGNYTYDGDVACTAKWTAKEITITWTDPEGGNQITDGTPSCYYDGAVTLPTTPERTGYAFGGWEVANN